MENEVQPQQAPIDQTINVLNPDQELVSIPKSQLREAINLGYSVAIPEDIKAYKEKVEFDKPGTAALAGAARAATFGLSDQALTKSGLVEPQTLEKLKEYNPTASTLGEVGGVGASLLIPGTPVARLAQASERIAARVAPEAANIATRAAAQGLGSAVEGAAYGLGQTVSEEALGDPNLNAQKVISNVGMGALLGGALGGAFKAGEVAVPAAVEGAKNALLKVDDFLKGDVGVGPLGRGYAKISSFVSGKSEETILDAIRKRALSLKDPSEVEGLATDFTKVLTETNNEVDKALRETFKDIRPQEAAKYLEGADSGIAKAEYQGVYKKLDDLVKEMRAEPDLYPQGYARTLELIRDGSAKRITNESSAADIFSELNLLKNRIDEEISYGKVPSVGDERAERLITGLRREIRDNLEKEEVWGQAATRQAAFNDAFNAFQNAYAGKNAFRSKFMIQKTSRSGRPVWEIDPVKVKTFFHQVNTAKGEARAALLDNYVQSAQNLVNQIEQSYASLPGKEFDKKAIIDGLFGNVKNVTDDLVKQAEFNKALNSLGGGAHNAYLGEGAAMASAALGHPVIGAGIETINLLRAPGLAIQRLAKLERIAQESARAMGYLSKAIFRSGVKVGEKYSGWIGSRLGAQTSRKDDYKTVSERVTKFANDPESLIAHLESQTKDLFDSAPGTTQGMQMAASQAVSFLSSKIPGPIDEKPLQAKYIPSQAEIEKFQRYYEIVEYPLKALAQVKSGTLTMETIETLNAVYPELYEDMKRDVIENLSKQMARGIDLPYQTKISLGMFLNMDLDDSTTQSSIASNQAAFMRIDLKNAQEQVQNQMKVTQGGLSKLSLSQSSKMPMQRSSERNLQS